PNPAGDFGVKQIIRTTHSRVVDGSAIDDRTYKWDRAGNKTQREDVRLGGPGSTHTYRYDSIYRLFQSMRSTPSGASETVTYNLDGVGNRLSVGGGAHQGTYTEDPTLPEPGDRQMNQYTTT